MVNTISLLVIAICSVISVFYVVKSYKSTKRSEELLSGTITTVPPRVRRNKQQVPDEPK